MPPPVIKDKIAWRIALLEHRRILLERLIAEFPNVLKTNRTKVELWRSRLKV